jgi:hypothetical protein
MILSSETGDPMIGSPAFSFFIAPKKLWSFLSSPQIRTPRNFGLTPRNFGDPRLVA